MRVPAIRRFPQFIVRRRQAAGMRNEYGEFIPGVNATAVLPASVQPVRLEDVDLPEGARLSERLRILVPAGIERVLGTADLMTWNGDLLLWNGDRMTWGGDDRFVPGDRNPLIAAFGDARGDEVEIDSMVYTVSESQLWAGSHTRAVLLRET